MAVSALYCSRKQQPPTVRTLIGHLIAFFNNSEGNTFAYERLHKYLIKCEIETDIPYVKQLVLNSNVT